MRKLATVFGFSALVLTPATVVAACVYTWDGSSSTAWDLPANWTTSGGPCAPNTFPSNGTQDVVIDNSITSSYPIFPAGTDYTINSLVMHDGSSGSPVTLEIPSGRTLTVDSDFSISDNGAAYVRKLGSGFIDAEKFEIVNTSGGSVVTVEVSSGEIQTY